MIDAIIRLFKKRGPVFEVKLNSAGKWYYHERRGSDIKNMSQAYASKANAKRAAKAKAAETANATWKVV